MAGMSSTSVMRIYGVRDNGSLMVVVKGYRALQGSGGPVEVIKKMLNIR